MKNVLTSDSSTLLDSMPPESIEVFKQYIATDGLKPSVALRKLMDTFNCPDIHVTTVVHLLEHAYPDIDMGRQGFRFRIVDSAYPNSNPSQFSDQDFDDGLEELQSLPPVEW